MGYRFSPVGPDTSIYVVADYGDLVLGADEALALDAVGIRLHLVVGLRHERDLGKNGGLHFGAEFLMRQVGSEVLESPVVDEDLRILRVSALHAKGVLLLFQRRLFLSVPKGLDGFGVSSSGAVGGSTSGLNADSLRTSFSAEASLPLLTEWEPNT